MPRETELEIPMQRRLLFSHAWRWHQISPFTWRGRNTASLISSIDDVVLCVSTFAIVLGGTPSSVVAGGVNDEKKPLGVSAAVPSSNEGVLTRLASWC